MAFCTECGYGLSENSSFCPNCGTKVKAGSPAEPESGGAETAFHREGEPAPGGNAFDANQYSAPGGSGGGYGQSGDRSAGASYTYNYNEGGSASGFGYPKKGENGAPQKDGNSKTAIIVIASVLVLLVVVTILVVGAIKNGSSADTPPASASPETTTPAPSTPSPGGGSIAGSGTVDNGDYYIAFIGAEEFDDVDNDPSIRIYYEFTNNSEHSQTAWYSLEWEITQDGRELESTYSWENVDPYYYDSLNIRPGITIQCCFQYKYNPRGGPVDVTVYGWDNGKSGGKVSCSYLPDSLPGAPAPYRFESFANPEWTLSLESAGYLDDGDYYIAVTDAELLDDYYGEPAIRIYYQFTNYTDESVSMYDALDIYTYQDGVALYWTYAEDETETDLNFDAEVKPDQTITASCVFTLRNENSNVEAEVESWYTYDAFGQTYKIR